VLEGILANHREAIVAFDFFAVPTLTFKLPYAFPDHRARPAEDSALQRYSSSQLGMGGVAVEGSFS